MDIKFQIMHFAEDTMLLSIINDRLISASDLNLNTETISKWPYQCELEFHPDVNKQAIALLFSHKKQIDQFILPPLFFNGTEVKKVNRQIHQGINYT